MVAFNYRRIPAVALARKLVADGRIGTVRHVRAQYLQDWIVDPEFPLVWRLQKDKAGSGALGDIGAHVIDLAQHVIGRVHHLGDRAHAHVRHRAPAAGPGPTGGLAASAAEGERATGPVTVDDAALFLTPFEGGAVGSFEATRFATGRKNTIRLEVNGSEGSLVFDFEFMNELQFHDRNEDPDTAGFRRIIVTEPTHPYVGAWWPPGPRARLRAHVHPRGRRPRDGDRARAPTPPPSFADGLQVQIGAGGRRAVRRRGHVAGRRRPGLTRSPVGGLPRREAPHSRAPSPHQPSQTQPAPDRTRGEPVSRPVTLFTGQWADLPFEEVCTLAAGWGYDGLEIACWGDHLDVVRAAEDPSYAKDKLDQLERHGLQLFAISNHLNGQAVCDDPIDERHQGIVNARVWGDGDPEGVRQRAAEEMKATARAARALGVDVVVGFTGSSIWKTVAMFPPVPPSMIDAGYQDFADRWNPILDVFDEVGVKFAHEVHPSEIAYDYWTTQRALEAVGHRAGVRPQLGPQPLRLAGPGPGRLHLGLQGPDLPRGLQGREASGGQRPQRPDGLAPAVGGPAPRLGLRVHRPRRRPVGGVLPHAQHHRLRRPDLRGVGGRRHGPPRRRPRGAGVRPPPGLRPAVGVVRRGLLQLRRPRPRPAAGHDRAPGAQAPGASAACGPRGRAAGGQNEVQVRNSKLSRANSASAGAPSRSTT